MAFETATCVVVRCDDCGSLHEDYDTEATIHYTSEEEARKSLTEEPLTAENENETYLWLITDQIQLCGRCRIKRICVERGHAWPDHIANPGHIFVHEGVARVFCDLCQESRPVEQGGGVVGDQ